MNLLLCNENVLERGSGRMVELTQDYLKEFLDYHPGAGVWRFR